MTGEITVRGRVLPIGGLKEKLLAAHRQGIREVVLPADNEKDLPDIPENIRNDMKLHFVNSMDEVLKIGAGEGDRDGADLGHADRGGDRGAVAGKKKLRIRGRVAAAWPPSAHCPMAARFIISAARPEQFPPESGAGSSVSGPQ